MKAKILFTLFLPISLFAQEKIIENKTTNFFNSLFYYEVINRFYPSIYNLNDLFRYEGVHFTETPVENKFDKILIDRNSDKIEQFSLFIDKDGTLLNILDINLKSILFYDDYSRKYDESNGNLISFVRKIDFNEYLVKIDYKDVEKSIIFSYYLESGLDYTLTYKLDNLNRVYLITKKFNTKNITTKRIITYNKNNFPINISYLNIDNEEYSQVQFNLENFLLKSKQDISFRYYGKQKVKKGVNETEYIFNENINGYFSKKTDKTCYNEDFVNVLSTENNYLEYEFISKEFSVSFLHYRNFNYLYNYFVFEDDEKLIDELINFEFLKKSYYFNGVLNENEISKYDQFSIEEKRILYSNLLKILTFSNDDFYEYKKKLIDEECNYNNYVEYEKIYQSFLLNAVDATFNIVK